MSELIFEWRRITTIRSTWICLGLAVIFGAGLGYLAGRPRDEYPGSTGSTWVEGLLAAAPLLLILGSVIASQSIGQEYRFGLIRLTLTSFPTRWKVLKAKVVFAGATAVAVMAAGMAGGLIGLAICGRLVPDGMSDGDAALLARTVVLAVLWCLSAYALAGITRQTALGIVVPLVSGYIVENLLRATLGNELRWLGNVLPWSNGLRGQIEGSFFDEMSLTGWGALAVFAVWVGILVAAHSMLFVRRDA